MRRAVLTMLSLRAARAFLRPAVSTVRRTAPVWSATESQQQQITDMLAFHVGPLASRLVKKMSKQHPALSDLVEALARHIPDHNERNQFLAKASKL